MATEGGRQDDDRPWPYEIAKRIPAWLAIVLGIEFERAKRIAHGRVNMVEGDGVGRRGRELCELRVVSARRKGWGK